VVAARPRRRIPTLVKVIVPVVAVVVVAAGGILISKQSAGRSPSAGATGTNCNTSDVGSGSPTDPQKFGVDIPTCSTNQYSVNIPGLGTYSPVSAGTLASVDPRALFWAMIKRQSTRSLTDLTYVTYPDPDNYAKYYPQGSANRVEIDYSTRRFASQEVVVNQQTGASTGHQFQMCTPDHVPHFWDPEHGGWMQPSPEDYADTQKDNSICSRLQGQLITIGKPQLIQGTDGKTYIQLDVQVNPQDPHDPADTNPVVYMAGAFLEAAFAQTGKNVIKWPYSIGVGESQGEKVRYYIDPSTLVPDYSVFMNTTPITANGQPHEASQFPHTYTLYEYSYPARFDDAATVASGTPTLTYRPWPFPQYTFPE
jgi:hypothetical protein